MSELYTKYATEQYVDNNLNIGLEAKADAEHNHDFSYDVKGAANTALNSAKEYVDEAVSSLGTIIATDENSDGNIVLRQYNPEEDFIQVDNTLSIEGAAADAKAVGDRIKNLTTSGDAPVLDAVLGADGIMNYNNSPAFDEWLTETEGSERFVPTGYVTEIIDIASETELDTALTNIISNMEDLTERHVIFQDNAGLFNGGYTLARIFIRVGTYATATFETYGYYGYTKWVKNCYGGSWYPLEWENPPMVVGVEYRTTERYMGYPVYTKLVDCGIPSNGKRVETGHGVIIRHSGNLNSNHSLPFNVNQSETSAYWAESQNEGATLILNCGTGFASNSYTWYERIWWINS